MPQYAVKLGEIHLKMDRPITEEQRKRVTAIVLEAAAREMLQIHDDEVRLLFIPV